MERSAQSPRVRSRGVSEVSQLEEGSEGLTVFARSSNDALRGKVFFTLLTLPDDRPSFCATLISLSTLVTCSVRSCFFFALATAASLFLSFSAIILDEDLRDFGRSTAPGLFVVLVVRDGGCILSIIGV